jgi:isopentenyldiphosphate isomerase
VQHDPSANAGELVDIVDEHDRVIATVPRRQMRAERLRHRGVSIAVLGSDGRLLVHRRAATKDVWPSMWDIAAGGVVSAGEDYETAARRELAEELGVEATELHDLGGGHFADAAVQVIGHGYATVHDGPFTFTDGEIDEVRWVSRAELEAMRAEHPFVPDNLALLLPRLHMLR